MRKRDPDLVVGGFQTELFNTLGDLRSLLHALRAETIALRKTATRDAFLRSATSFEAFRSDWIVAAVNRDSSAFGRHQQAQIEESLERKHSALSGHVQVSIPKHLSLQLIHDTLDPNEYNIGIPTAAEWASMGEKYTVDPYRRLLRDTLTTKNRHLIDAVISLRNTIAHRSPNAVKKMNSNLEKVEKPLRRPKKKVSAQGVAHYLHAQSPPSTGLHRVEIYLCRLIETSGLLLTDTRLSADVQAVSARRTDAHPTSASDELTFGF